MLPRAFWVAGLLVAVLGQLFLLADLVSGSNWLGSSIVWLAAHFVFSVVATLCSGRLLQASNKDRMFYTLLLSFNILMPLAGPLGSFLALYLGNRNARLRHREPDYWIITRRAELPFTTPSGRKAIAVDSRGFVEQLMYSRNDDDLYRKVLSVADVQSALSVGTLKEAMRHKDERIRLTAYNMLDRKVTALNRQIQQLEAQVAKGNSREMSNSWLQIASNYWELLTLEKGEPIARKQLLEKASHAAISAIAALPTNRNAHFVLGRVSILQGNMRRAKVAFRRAKALGMPTDKVMPYLAESAFVEKDYNQVRELLQQLDPAIRSYPPLSHVAEYWS